MPGSDRRPWLILSRREGQALLAALNRLGPLEPDLLSAHEQLRLQLAWIEGGPRLNPPTIERAIEREYQRL